MSNQRRPNSVRNGLIIRLESISPTLIHPTARDDQQQQPTLQPNYKRLLFFSFFFFLLRPINSLISCAPNWRRPGHSFRLLIQVTLIQREQSGPLVWCHVCHWISEVPPCEAAEAKCNPNNKTTPGVGNLSPCGCSCRERVPPPFPPSPVLCLSTRPPRWVTPRPTLISNTGIKTNIFSLKSDLNERMISGETLLTERQDAAFLAALSSCHFIGGFN